ncbi:MAG: isochorismatase family protein [Chloroflexi bacterium]|nr:MAG: isochorismatase family protein [Chloroflexota bacterium]
MSTALLVIDGQRNMFEPDAVYQGDVVRSTIRSLIHKARIEKVPIIYMQNCGGPGEPDEPGTTGWVIHPDLAPDKDDVVLKKHCPDSFHQTQLANVLKKRKVNRLILVGMQTELCVDTTCRRANVLGYEVVLVADGHSTFDAMLPAAQIIAHHNDVLEVFAKVETAVSVNFTP